jgi:hypothetical protein
MATCLACGADTFNLTDLGEVHSAGRDVEWDAAAEGSTEGSNQQPGRPEAG